LRAKALAGGDVDPFERWGMILMVPGHRDGAHRICEIQRRRASVRAGDFSLIGFLIEMGIAGVTSRPHGKNGSKEVS
jgi:hypothetical protein